MSNLTRAMVKQALLNVPALFNPHQAAVLFELARRLPDGASILEIGAWKGYSTCALAYGCFGTAKHVWTIDTFRGFQENTNAQGADSYRAEFEKNVATHGLGEYVTALEGKSEDFYKWDRALDMLFIDGNHLIMNQDLAAFFPRLKAGGFLAMHDVADRADARALTEIMGISGQVGKLRGTLNLMWTVKWGGTWKQGENLMH